MLVLSPHRGTASSVEPISSRLLAHLSMPGHVCPGLSPFVPRSPSSPALLSQLC